VDANAQTIRSGRIKALRRYLTDGGIDGFIQPRADEHQGEYVPPCAERLSWLTGFTGSAGTAVILKDKAALFTDGRYTLQAETEVGGDLLEIIKTPNAKATDWVAANLGSGKLGFDPRLMTANQVKRFRAACEKAGGELVALETNPVDSLWDDRPDPPMDPIVPYKVAYAGEDHLSKRGRIADTLKEANCDAAVLSAPDSIAWLLNVRGSDVPFTPFALCFAVLHADGTVDLFTDPAKVTKEVKAHLGEGVRIDDAEAFGPALDELGREKKTVRVDPDGSSEWISARLENSGASIDTGADPCQLPKARKNKVELAGIRAAHLRDGQALTRFLAWLAKSGGDGTDEIAAAEKLEGFRAENGLYRGPSFTTISGAGPNGAIVHYRVTPETSRKLETGMLYLVDSGGQYPDGTTDVTRTIAIGEPSDEMRDRFTRVLKGHIALASARFPEGTTGSQLDPLARRALWEAGLDYDHGTGHGVGCYLSVHEGPQRIAKVANSIALEAGMVVSVEPGFYKSGAYGIRIENLVAVIEAPAPEGAERGLLAFETLTTAPIDRNLIEAALMTADEIAWLDAYHSRVLEQLSPLVDEETAAWLAEATRPLL